MRELHHTDVTSLSTFKLPSEANRLVILESKDDVIDFFTKDRDGMSGNFYLIGGGSNTFLSTHVGCLVQLDIKGITWGEAVTVSASEEWDHVVGESVRLGYTGLEALSAIPGTAGAAPVQNIGAYGREFADVCRSVTAFDRSKGAFVVLSPRECTFGYRNSIFKREKNKHIIVEMEIGLEKYDTTMDAPLPKYPGVEDMVKKIKDEKKENMVTPATVREAITKIRWSKLPEPSVTPNVGSCFENPIIEEAVATELKKKYSDMPVYPIENGNDNAAAGKKSKVSAGWLIDSCGLKSISRGGISVYEKHALVLINKDKKGTMADLQEMVKTIQDGVRAKFGIELRLEPNVVL